jgi:hypothetical protein
MILKIVENLMGDGGNTFLIPVSENSVIHLRSYGPGTEETINAQIDNMGGCFYVGKFNRGDKSEEPVMQHVKVIFITKYNEGNETFAVLNGLPIYVMNDSGKTIDTL